MEPVAGGVEEDEWSGGTVDWRGPGEGGLGSGGGTFWSARERGEGGQRKMRRASHRVEEAVAFQFALLHFAIANLIGNRI